MNNPIHGNIKKLNELLCNVSLPDVFTFPGKERAELSVKLIVEEVEETIKALREYNLEEIYDGVADSRVVIYGAGVWFGLNLDACISSINGKSVFTIHSHVVDKKEMCSIIATELKFALEDFIDAISNTNVESTITHQLTRLLSTVNGMYLELLRREAIPYVSLRQLDDIVHASNMSKLCKSEADAIKGCESYKTKGVDVYYERHKTEPFWTIYRKDGKFLKGPDFKAPDFTPFLGGFEDGE